MHPQGVETSIRPAAALRDAAIFSESVCVKQANGQGDDEQSERPQKCAATRNKSRDFSPWVLRERMHSLIKYKSLLQERYPSWIDTPSPGSLAPNLCDRTRFPHRLGVPRAFGDRRQLFHLGRRTREHEEPHTSEADQPPLEGDEPHLDHGRRSSLSIIIVVVVLLVPIETI